ncbi:protein-glutamate O-methyltransferase CheR [Methanogenium marinum]|uniref:Protein-glutamate O-methyltransferase CheR n=1 Tax=Methanogenium marinum TaxID=348610 RepID=A0A9Q4KSY1_9EURY|nr:protein-glutamate O-methyltransferase CheR [Methanogenium marinum]MDE4908009.1 protein-glutamate O-methyltransferase CheR [Methanogenium marinum]
MKTDLQKVITVMSRAYGTDLSCYDESVLSKSLETRCIETSSATIDEYCTYLSEHREEAGALSRSLQNTHSEFFRNPLTFALLESLVLPSLLMERQGAEGRGIRVWSAGCAAGEEAYSIAILLNERATASEHPAPYQIFATDISEDELAHAKSGVYDAARVQNVHLKHLHTYFHSRGDTYTVIPRLQDHIDFSRYDLLDEHSISPPTSIYGGFDLIFCANLLFYYRPEVRQSILEKLNHSLVPGGYLVTGEAEREMVEQLDNIYPVFRSAAVYRKSSRTHMKTEQRTGAGTAESCRQEAEHGV